MHGVSGGKSGTALGTAVWTHLACETVLAQHAKRIRARRSLGGPIHHSRLARVIGEDSLRNCSQHLHAFYAW